ncbi:MAG: chorismate synthase [Oscillospiraceae bacterium]|nr:chorismate synthase [Oscillospiraceae bacterium]
MSNTYGSALKLSIFGQSHAPAIGMTLEGLPAGFCPDLEKLQVFLNRRAPGQGAHTTARKEPDVPEFLSGLVNGVVCGAPLCAVIRNTNVRSQDYVNLQESPRPSHADYPARVKYGTAHDGRGGGKYSGRLTAPLCIAGGLCLQLLEERGIRVGAQILQIAGVKNPRFDPISPEIPSAYNVPTEEMLEAIAQAKAQGDSVGGIVECAATGLPVGLGEPMFDGLENRLAQLLFAIPGVRGVDFGAGFDCASMLGSEHNDCYYVNQDRELRTRSNHAGGVVGGMSTGMPLILRAAFKPTASIAKVQESCSFDGTRTKLQIQGRHDPCIVPRALPCVEAAMAIALVDTLLEAGL